jgi:hypothetical protein
MPEEPWSEMTFLRAISLYFIVEHDPLGRARGHAFPKTDIHPGSGPGQAFFGIML